MALMDSTINEIKALAARSGISSYHWPDRGIAPMGYVKGMAVAMGTAHQKLLESDPAAQAMVIVVNAGHDVFDEYNPEFVAAGMSNYNHPDRDRLRHLYAFLMGLGMRESSGRYCEGRDMSASNTSSDTAEAGLFQQSWNLRSTNDEITRLFTLFNGLNSPRGFVEIFREGVESNDGEFDCYGSGDGERFQETCKLCPDFAVETAAIGLRTLCNHWGPVMRHEVDLNPAVDVLYRQVQSIVDTTSRIV